MATPTVMTSYSSLSRISIISAAVITCGSFGKCLRFPVTKKESFRKPTFNSLYDPFGSPVSGGQKPQGRRGKPLLLVARNRYALRLAGHQSPRHILRDGTALL